jgi:tripeptidyl-peptidase-1
MHLMVSVLTHKLLACGALLIISSHIAPTAPTERLGTIQPLTPFILTLHPAGIKVGTKIPKANVITDFTLGKLQCGVYKPTQVISASYGECEQDLPYDYTARQCNEFLKLGLQGVSITIASGDYGVASSPGDGGPNGCLGPEGKIFNPQYPSNCPYVTSVGATQLYADQTVLDKESVMQVNLGGSAANFSSSGGFSNYFPQPSYQKAAVEEYFAAHNPSYPYYSQLQVDLNTTKGLYNRIGRAYPDVASNGAYMPAYVNGELNQWFGTSLAAPTFASILTLVSDSKSHLWK